MLTLLWRVPLAVLLVVEILSATIITDVQPSFTIFGLILQSTVTWLAFEIMYWYIRKHKKKLFWWIPVSIVIPVYLDAIGDYLFWYDQFRYYDAVLHFIVPAVITSVLANIIPQFRPNILKQSLWPFMIASLVIVIGVVYEIEEYLEDLIFGSNRLGDGFDTANDLLMDVLGALLPAVIIYIYTRIKRAKR